MKPREIAFPLNQRKALYFYKILTVAGDRKPQFPGKGQLSRIRHAFLTIGQLLLDDVFWQRWEIAKKITFLSRSTPILHSGNLAGILLKQ